MIGACTNGTNHIKGKKVVSRDSGVVPFAPKFCGMKTNGAACMGACWVLTIDCVEGPKIDCATFKGLDCKACLSKLASLVISLLRLSMSLWC